MGVMFTPEDIKDLRRRLNLTLQEFGALLGVSKSTVSYWEMGDRHPKYSTLVKLNDLARKHRDAGPVLVP